MRLRAAASARQMCVQRRDASTDAVSQDGSIPHWTTGDSERSASLPCDTETSQFDIAAVAVDARQRAAATTKQADLTTRAVADHHT